MMGSAAVVYGKLAQTRTFKTSAKKAILYN